MKIFNLSFSNSTLSLVHFLNTGNAEASKLAAQTQANQMQQMQSAVQLLARGVLTRQQDNLRTQGTQQAPWTSQPVSKHPGMH